MWGIIPAAGRGSRIQPLAFSKELLPVGSRHTGAGDRPCAVSEYLVDRMICGGVDKLAFVIGPGKSDILNYYGAGYDGATFAYLLQPSPAGLCDAIFRAAPLLDGEPVLIGLLDTIWFPRHGFAALPDDRLSFLLFPVARPDLFDAVLMNEDGRVQSIEVKRPGDASRWIWGAIKMPCSVFHALHRLWKTRDRCDEYFGTLVNAYLVEGGEAVGVRAGESYVDVGTLDGYRSAMRMLDRPEPHEGGGAQDVGIAEPFGRSPAQLLAQ
jgi:dTDP-glucose pyrophosphorylase